MLQIDTYETVVTLGIRYAMKKFEYFIFVYIVKLQNGIIEYSKPLFQLKFRVDNLVILDK